jgi:phage gpG-like protein
MASNFPHPFKKFKEDLTAYVKDLPMIVSGIAEKEFVENFKRQGYRTKSGVVKWKKRKKETTKDEGRALLIKRGRLRRGFKKRPTSGVAKVINDVPYAAAHNQGDKSSVSVGSSERRIKKKKGKVVSVRAYTRKNNLPARPFMITTEPLLKDIEKKVINDLKAIFNK